MNTFTHMRASPPIEFRAVPRASTDTLYSLAWLDLTVEPLILSVPDTAGRITTPEILRQDSVAETPQQYR